MPSKFDLCNNINRKKMLNRNQIKLQLRENDEVLAKQFPHDELGDVKIVYKQKIFHLRKCLLELYSQYFRNILSTKTTIIYINQDFNHISLTNVLSLFYGHEVSIERSEILKYFPILQYFQLNTLVAAIKKDIDLHPQCYSIFFLMNIAQRCYDHKLFLSCSEQLQKQRYQQMRTQQQALVQLQLVVFKLIIKAHNQFKKIHQTNISYIKIFQIINQYAALNNLEDRVITQIKWELFDVSALTSNQYWEIFMHQVHNKQGKVEKRSSLLQNVVSLDCGRLSLSPTMKKRQASGISQIQKKNSKNQHKMLMMITFLKKRNKELVSENHFLTSQLKKIKTLTQENEKVHQEMRNDIIMLKQELAKKQKRELQNQKILNEIQPLLEKLQQQIEKKSAQIDELVKNQERSKKFFDEPSVDESTRSYLEQSTRSNEGIVKSQFLSAFFIHQMFSGPSEIAPSKVAKTPLPKSKLKRKESQVGNKIKKILAQVQGLDDEELEQLYVHRVEFDEKPRSVKNSELPQVCRLLSEDFKKKNCKLLYRRSNISQPKGERIDIRNKKNLLILMNTQFGQHIGGYISSSLAADEQCLIEDKKAFLFTITKDKRLPINKDRYSSAIRVSSDCLLSFGNDLVISNNCVVQKSKSDWPCSYSNSGSKECPQWLTGGRQFLIKDIEIYEITEIDMEMVL